MDGSAPIVGILATSTSDAGLDAQIIDDKYLLAAMEVVGAVPVILPTLFGKKELERILPMLDGVILTGDASNLQPSLYGADGNAKSHGPFDAKRDASAFELIQMAFDRDIPLLGICRGMQEMNVVLGGTMRNDVNENKSFDRHHPTDYSQPPCQRYGAAHELKLESDGLLAEILGPGSHSVNSLHEQAVETLAPALMLDATSEDGLIEAFHHPNKRFFMGLQWHAEFAAKDNAISIAIFKAFERAMGSEN
jgi:putative glutamine amidotransferase